MTMQGHGAATTGTSPVVHFDGEVRVRLPDRTIGHAHAELIGGRNRYSVGGETAEGPRWWRGTITWDSEVPKPAGGIEISVEVDNGRAGVAVIELDPTSPAHTARLHGVSTPPFDVP